MRKVVSYATRVLIVLLFLGFFFASHMITGLAAITSTAISAIAGTASTVMGRSKATVHDLDLQNARLRADLDLERAETARLKKVDAVTFRGRSTTVKQATREVLDNTLSRTKRSAFANVSSIPGESIPVVGIAIVLAATTYELKAACDNMKDLYDLQVAIDADSARPENVKSVCALQVPTRQEVWDGVKHSPMAAWDSTIAALESVTDSVKTLEAPDFGDTWESFRNWMPTPFGE